MNATAQQTLAADLESGIDPVYFSREDLAVVFPPVNGYERALLNRAALAHQRVLRAYDLERQILAKTDLVELFTQSPDQFKAIARYIADCDRLYQHAIAALERAHRARAKSAHAAFPPPLPAPEIRSYKQIGPQPGFDSENRAAIPATPPHPVRGRARRRSVAMPVPWDPRPDQKPS